jgi:hypothetical protein
LSLVVGEDIITLVVALLRKVVTEVRSEVTEQLELLVAMVEEEAEVQHRLLEE